MEIQFRVTPTCLLHKVFCAYADRRSLELNSFKCLFEGDVLHPHHTVQKYGIESGDTVDVMVSMLGD